MSLIVFLLIILLATILTMHIIREAVADQKTQRIALLVAGAIILIILFSRLLPLAGVNWDLP